MGKNYKASLFFGLPDNDSRDLENIIGQLSPTENDECFNCKEFIEECQCTDEELAIADEHRPKEYRLRNMGIEIIRYNNSAYGEYALAVSSTIKSADYTAFARRIDLTKFDTSLLFHYYQEKITEACKYLNFKPTDQAGWHLCVVEE
jgi:hypothetical protein